MNPELYGSSPPPDAEGPAPAISPEPAPAPVETRAAMETSVLDALRPLLRAKRPKKPREPGDREQTGSDRLGDDFLGAADQPAGPTFETSYGSDILRATDRTVTSRAAAEDEFETFATIGEELERKSRQSATMVRLLEQHRQQLQMAEKGRDEAYEQLTRVVPVVHETAQALREAMDARKIDDDPARMHKLFMLNGRALDELEKVSVNLFADFLWCKSAWEQYARSVEDARKLRSSLDV